MQALESKRAVSERGDNRHRPFVAQARKDCLNRLAICGTYFRLFETVVRLQERNGHTELANEGALRAVASAAALSD